MDYTTWDEAAAAAAAGAPSAHRLTTIEVVMDADLHGVWLDETTGLVWHAAADMDDMSRWTLESEPAGAAIEWLEEQCCLVLDALADPEGHYDTGHRTPEDDLEVLDELHAVRLAGMRAAAAEPVNGVTTAMVVDAEIRGRIEQARRQVGLLADLRAYHLSVLTGGQRGGLARVARDLGLTARAVTKVIAAAAKRRDGIIAAARAPRQEN